MIKCPQCGRKFPDPGPGVEFRLGDHLNYMKTAPCPASGRRFVNAGGVYSDVPARHSHMPGELAALSAVALWAGESARPRSRRRYR